VTAQNQSPTTFFFGGEKGPDFSKKRQNFSIMIGINLEYPGVTAWILFLG